MLPSIRRVSYTDASGSKPKSNAKNDRIQRIASRSKKNKVESQPRKCKSSASKNNHVSNCNANVKNVALSKNFDTICLSCNESIMGYGDLHMGNILISHVYYVEGLGHNLFFVGKFCDTNLEVAFRKHTCFVHNLEGLDLLLGSRSSNLYTISMADMMKSFPIYLLSKALKTKSWLWHRRHSHLNFGTINQLAKQGLVKGFPKLKYIKDHLCLACQMGKSKKESHPHKPKPSTNEKLQMLHMDLCRLMWVESINKKRNILVIVDDYSLRYLRTDNDTEFLNQTLRNYIEEVGITHNTSTARTPQQNGVVERRYRTSWEIIAKVDIGIFIGYLASKKAYRIYNKRSRKIMETINVKFGKLTQMVSEQHGSGPELHGLTYGHISSELVQNQDASPSAKPPIMNDWDLLFQPMFDEYFKPLSVVSTPISTVTILPSDIARASSSTSIDKDVPSSSTSPNNETTSPQINFTNVEEPHNEEVIEFDSDIFTNPFAPPDTSSAASSSRIVDTSNMHTFQQPYVNTKRWTKDHSVVTIIVNLSKPVSTRRQLKTDALWCYFHAFLVKEEPNNYKEAIIESSWIEAM
ncbi:retrovirus-related pol polyprotein from transposon TNT 1-94 [Tanacetum coccineum]